MCQSSSPVQTGEVDEHNVEKDESSNFLNIHLPSAGLSVTTLTLCFILFALSYYCHKRCCKSSSSTWHKPSTTPASPPCSPTPSPLDCINLLAIQRQLLQPLPPPTAPWPMDNSRFEELPPPRTTTEVTPTTTSTGRTTSPKGAAKPREQRDIERQVQTLFPQ